MNRINVLGIKYCDMGVAEAVEYSVRAVSERRGGYVLLPDSELALEARKNRRLMAAIRGAELVLPGDKGIYTASDILGMPLHYSVSAQSFSSALFARLGGMDSSVYFVGARCQTAQAAAERLIGRYPGLKLAGVSNGQFVDDTELIDDINAAAPDILVVCLASPRQELWIYESCAKLNVGMTIALGDALEPKSARHKESALKRLASEPKTTLKIPRVTLAALWKRITGIG